MKDISSRRTECFDRDGIEIYEGDTLKNKVGEVFFVYFERGSFFIHNLSHLDDTKDIPLYMIKTFPKIIKSKKKPNFTPQKIQIIF